MITLFSVLLLVGAAVCVDARDRYLLYSVNPGEGFNLARDVFMRVAMLMDKLKEESPDTWTLVRIVFGITFPFFRFSHPGPIPTGALTRISPGLMFVVEPLLHTPSCCSFSI